MEQINETDTKKYYEYLSHINPTEVRVFDEVKYPNGSSVSVNTFRDFIGRIRYFNETQEVDVYAGARDRITKGDSGVVSSSFIFIEIDEHDVQKPLELEKVKQFYADNNIKIGMIGFSGGGFHLYIPHKKIELLTDESRFQYKNSLLNHRRILKQAGIDVDDKVFNLERVTRVLGSYNYKRKQLSKIIYYDLNIDLEANFNALQVLRDKFEEVEEQENEVVNESALELLKKYNIDINHKWLYDLINLKVKIKPDTGGNSIVYKNSAIILSSVCMSKAEIDVVAKEIAKSVEDRPLSAFYGHLRRCIDNSAYEIYVNQFNDFVIKNGYPLTLYELTEQEKQENKEHIQKLEKKKREELILPLKVMSLTDYDNHKVNKNYIIQGRIFPKENELRYAPSGSLKSIYSLYEALTIASGKKLLGKFKVKRKPVLYVSAENNVDTDKLFIKKIMRGLGLRKRDIPFYVLPRTECSDILSITFVEQLVKTIKQHKIEVIYLDTINPLTPDIDDNKAKDVTMVFNNFLKPLNDKSGCYVCFLHHTTKEEGTFLGSMKWKANSDCVTRIERKGLDNRLKIYNEKNRRGESNTLELEVIFDDVKEKIIFKLLSEGKPAIFSKKQKMTQGEFFALKLNELVKDKETKREEIFKIFTDNKIKYSKGSLDRAIGEWRE